MLRQRAHPVERITDLHRRLVSDMIETMREAPGVGLAGTQVGVLERIFVWEVEDRFGAVINPVITSASDESEVEDEGCLSLPGLLYPVSRRAAVNVEGLDADGAQIVVAAEGLLARVFQHEIDHLDGTLFIDRLPEELRREAMGKLRHQALGLAPAPRAAEAAEAGGGL